MAKGESLLTTAFAYLLSSWKLSGLVCIATYLLCKIAQTLREYQADSAIGRRHGCGLPPELTKRWPLGVDRIKEIWTANADGRLLAFFCSVADGYEPRNNLTQHLLFGPRGFNILHPDNVEAVLSTNFQDFSFGPRPSVFAPLIGNGIFTQEGAPWKHSRELLRKQFARVQYQNLHLFREHFANLVACMPIDGELDLQPLLFNLTLDVATTLLLGHSTYSLRAGVDQAAELKQFADDFNVAQEGLAKRFRLAPFHSLYNPPSFRKACHRVHVFIERYIRDNDLMDRKGGDEASPEGTAWFINRLAEESTSIVDLRDQLLNVLLAGRDTTACCLSWTCRLLIRHPQVMQRLRVEIESVMGESVTPTREQIRKMPYLSYVIQESLRLYPSVPLNVREANKTTVLPTGGGPDGTSPMLVRRGEVVVFSQYISSRRKNIYGADADNFRPERWETGELSGIGWAYFPFNGGPRKCLGEDFALMEVSYIIVGLLQTFSTFDLPQGEPIEPVGTERQRLTLVLSSEDGCKVAVRKNGKSL
ncbi:cytochrome P450 [Xylariales sp. PMI_506]|nr:cytochrome P450 [Xylariales sp. PMI_506]